MAGKLTLSVSQLNEYVRRTLQMDPMLARIDLQGEISNLKLHQSGMLFFTLKDDLASIACTMMECDVQRLSSMPFEGMRVVLTGSVGLYTRAGRYQFYASELRAEGVGALYERLLALKGKLSAEGLFAPERKRPLPAYVKTIGVVTSPTGAVIHDICHVAFRRDPCAHILLCPSRVQGVGADEEIVRAIGMLEQIEAVSVIIVARGGGSMEDLWNFNEECVVRAIAQCRKPVISAVGHETDVTLSDLAADLRAPTPSAAAECAVPIRKETENRLRSAKEALSAGLRGRLEEAQGSLTLLRTRLEAGNPARQIGAEQERLERAKKAMRSGMMMTMSRAQDRLDKGRRDLQLLSPYGVLARGYAIVMRGGTAAERAEQIMPGDDVTLRFADGTAWATVSRVSINQNEEET
ncbi:MAG: exodeoxyribonuclease VII large subunit [Clostridia bacterium]|nr:exodeoxyribonuclease VII large subunit [Clostridia bacterium]